MSTHSDKDKHDNLQPEDSGIVVKPVAMFLIILFISTAFVFVLVKGMTYLFEKQDAAGPAQPSTRVAGGARLSQREPLLQGAPQADPSKPGEKTSSLLPLDELAKYRQKVEEEVKSYGWVAGKENSEARLPIERAKQLLLEKGLPVKADAAVAELQAAEKARKQIYNADASAGRLIGKQ